MKTTISENPRKELNTPKIKALFEQLNSGQLKSDSAKILAFVKKRPGANKLLICGYFNYKSSHTVTARLSDLEDLGLIESKGEGKYSQYFFIKEENAQRIHAAQRAAEKLEQWVKKGLSLDIPQELKTELLNLNK